MSRLETLFVPEEGVESSADTIIQEALDAVRAHFGMPIAYLSEIVGAESVFRSVSAPGLEDLIKPGDRRPLDAVYCQHILDGRLPELIPDTGAVPFAQTLPITREVPIGAHVSVPIRRADGSLYGMFCCLSPEPRPSLNPRDLSIMEMFASLSARHLNARLSAEATRRALAKTIGETLENGLFHMVFQPIFDLDGGRPTGFEALCRFDGLPYRSPDQWFRDAARIGQQSALEAATIRAALPILEQLPADVSLSVNASPSAVADGAIGAALKDAPAERIVLEITEHDRLENSDSVIRGLDRLRARGVKLAIDDVGAGYSGLQQILRLRPDILKLDLSLTADIDTDPARRALTVGLVQFARETGAILLAEGIERAEEAAVLRTLGVDRGQGYFLGRPARAEEALAGLAGKSPPRGSRLGPAFTIGAEISGG
ncbi:EAL domain-containing protein [Aestuariibius sp. 2305UL40-4]|uniref:sensor domain-containing phosphodiesterase n=1 Tax=Aestuariibius violaceus TaxID=3234132 RepID=UPI00345E9BE3